MSLIRAIMVDKRIVSTTPMRLSSFSARPGRRRSLPMARNRLMRTCARRKNVREQAPDYRRLRGMVGTTHDDPSPRRQLADIQRIDDDQGWGFVACCDIAESQTLVSVPLSETIMGIDDAGMEPWNVQMVEQLLQRLYGGTAEPWMDALPTHVDLPFLYWDDEDIARLGDPAIIAEIVTLRDFCGSSGVRAYMSGYDWEDVLWGFSLVHSRSFVYSEGKHLFSPLIDMANHDDAPNATVKLTHSPDRCQGQVATDEIAPRPPRPTPASSGVFELFATRDIAAGEQCTISYGAHPNDVLLLYFGFALPSNENDAITVTIEDLQAVEGFTDTDEAGGDDRFIITWQGVDPRLLERVVSPTALAELCRWKLDQFLDIERRESDADLEPGCKDRRRAAACYRRSKIELLQNAVASLSEA